MFAAATSFFAGSNISRSYNIGGATTSRAATPATPGTVSTTAPHAPTFKVGPWRVQSATHKTSGKRASVWDFDKRSPWLEKLNPPARERALEVLKAEASALGRLRHPNILEMVEPLEETRTELIFATEPILSSLHLSIPGAARSSLVELDEVEIQKGILQVFKGLSFLHTSARMIHSNINPESILINSAGDWKIGGLGLTISLTKPDGSPTRWEFPTFDGRMDPYVQRSFDYMAPEYALDEVLTTASDMYSIGCLIYTVHSKGDPPFRNHGSLSGLRDNAGKPLPGIHRFDRDLQAILGVLITRQPQIRPSPESLPTHSFFSSLPISTLNFLDRTNFATKSREEKISFMKGLTNVLDKFSEGLRVRKILPSLLEEMKDTHLLPYILPNVFAIASALSAAQFGNIVLPNLKPLFIVKEPPQNMLTLLDNLHLLQTKTDKAAFREHVLPLVYHALESEHAAVQEKALSKVPDLCETIDYAEVQAVLFPRVALVFTKTRILSVKIATLATFLAMVKTLDQTSLTKNLVPLLSKIRTKEPGVMMGTLAVQEAMGLKVDREAVATLVLPQLWAMSIGPLLNVDQFERFMSVIRKLGERVEKEHHQFLRDSQRIADRSAATANDGVTNGAPKGPIDFESLVAQGSASVKADSNAVPNWDDDPWGSILGGNADTPPLQSPTVQAHAFSPPPAPAIKPFTSSSANTTRSTRSLGVIPLSSPSISSSSMSPPILPPHRINPPPSQPSLPNYNISLPTVTPNSFSVPTAPVISSTSAMPALSSTPSFNGVPLPSMTPGLSMTSPPLFAQPNIGSSILAPTKPATPAWNSGGTKQLSKSDWGDFDPLG